MAMFLFRRLITLMLTLLVTATVVFVVLEILPGDPASVMLGLNAEPDTVAALRAQLGLDKPLAERFFGWLGGMIEGDFGRSYTYSVPVIELLADRVTITVPLALFAITLSTLIAIPLGVFAARNHNKLGDVGVIGFSHIGVAVPTFWFALLLIILFAVNLGWTSAGGFPGWDAGIGPALSALLLPAISLALPQAAILARITRSSVLEVLREDYVRTARAKGLDRRAALWRHAVPNALIPVVTILGLQISSLLTGTIIIENVFALPGIGRLIFQAIAQRDLIMVKSLVVIIAAAVVFVNFLVDLSYAVLDPRLRRGGNML